MNLNSLDIENDMLPQDSQKPFWPCKFSSKRFCLVSEKAFALRHFLKPKNCIFEALWKQMSVFFFFFLQKFQ